MFVFLMILGIVAVCFCGVCRSRLTHIVYLIGCIVLSGCGIFTCFSAVQAFRHAAPLLGQQALHEADALFGGFTVALSILFALAALAVSVSLLLGRQAQSGAFAVTVIFQAALLPVCLPFIPLYPGPVRGLFGGLTLSFAAGLFLLAFLLHFALRLRQLHLVRECAFC
ncbi:MAG: hypothetical protein Q4G07_11035 [Oscillospiraceae bacterium]|nr:hypothetical protein [Oscillospiraceae bacterium]